MIERTISAMVGKGSTRHNSRAFIADNIVTERTSQNIEYCNEKIETVYHILFDEALERYNAKQKRDDRKIENYYEKIRSGKQEKPFHEVIFQIGNRFDMASGMSEGELAKEVLDDFYHGFVERNKTLRVFSAHLHMDEATPHLHIDFVPFTTGSTRGLDTRVSLKKALFDLGFAGGSKQENEWNQWIESEKQQLALVMERYGIDRTEKNEHREHLSVLNYKREERAKEVEELTEKIQELEKKRDDLSEEITEKKEAVNEVKQELSEISYAKDEVTTDISEYYNSPDWRIPEPTAFMGIKKYIHELIEPFVARLKNVISKLIGTVHDYSRRLSDAYRSRDYYEHQNRFLKEQNGKLREDSELLNTIWGELGDEKVNEILAQAEQRQYEDYDEEYEEEHQSHSWGGMER